MWFVVVAGGEPTLKEDVGKSHTAAQVQVNHLLGGELQDYFLFVLDFCKTGYKTNKNNKTKKSTCFFKLSHKNNSSGNRKPATASHTGPPTGYFMGDWLGHHRHHHQTPPPSSFAIVWISWCRWRQTLPNNRLTSFFLLLLFWNCLQEWMAGWRGLLIVSHLLPVSVSCNVVGRSVTCDLGN